MKEMLYAVRCLRWTNLKNSGDSTGIERIVGQVNLLGSCFPVKGMSYERNVICSAVFEIK